MLYVAVMLKVVYSLHQLMVLLLYFPDQQVCKKCAVWCFHVFTLRSWNIFSVISKQIWLSQWKAVHKCMCMCDLQLQLYQTISSDIVAAADHTYTGNTPVFLEQHCRQDIMKPETTLQVTTHIFLPH